MICKPSTTTFSPVETTAYSTAFILLSSKPFLVIVDGLDECDGDQSKLLLHILELVNLMLSPSVFSFSVDLSPKYVTFSTLS